MDLFSLGRVGILGIDRVLKWRHGVFEYSQDASCILRLARSRSPRRLMLADGMQIEAGAPVLELHFWNERLEKMAAEGPLYGARLLHRMRCSLAELAVFVSAHPEFIDIGALRAETGFIQDASMEQARRICDRLGLEMIEGDKPGWRVFHAAFWANVFSWWLLRAFNPDSARAKSFTELRRCELWMSRSKLFKLYGAPKRIAGRVI